MTTPDFTPDENGALGAVSGASVDRSVQCCGAWVEATSRCTDFAARSMMGARSIPAR